MPRRGRPSKRSIGTSEFDAGIAAHAPVANQGPSGPMPSTSAPVPLAIRERMTELDMEQAKIREAVHRANMAAIDEQASRVRYEVERGNLVTKAQVKDMLQESIVTWVTAIEQVAGKVRGRLLDDPRTILLADLVESIVTQEIDALRLQVHKDTRA